MYSTIIVVDDPALLPAMDLTVIGFNQYLADYPKTGEPKTRIINLCDTEKYLSQGYYCSLLAEARQHKVLPSVNAINDLSLLLSDNSEFDGLLFANSLIPKNIVEEHSQILIFFGWTENETFKKLAKHIFERFPAPILKVMISHASTGLKVVVSAIGIDELDDENTALFMKRLLHFTEKVWRPYVSRKKFRWDMAILVDHNEKTPPSDKKALQMFVKAAAQVGINAELFEAKQLSQISQFDALFIRETTAIQDHTYMLARKGEREGLVVMDDPTSILRCCNKVFLHDAFSYNKVPSPRTRFIYNIEPQTIEQLEVEFSYPMVLKMPESAFSAGVFKVKTPAELKAKLTELLQQSALVLVQEYLYTDYDWRVGVLNGRPIYACRYFMARGHWQIYNHSSKKDFTGDFETLPTFEVPKPVLDAAVKASSIIGNGLYGVDLKQVNNQVYVIEVNDNPSIESDVEDIYLGKELYMVIMQEFANRLEARGR
jgi:glutathione synthase/RimK-type ligase-like ATP-grasp enzyme